MWLVFADDSEITTQTRRAGLGHLVGVGAVLFPEEALVPYTEGMRELRTELGIPAETELKWSPDKGSWLKSDAGAAVRTELRQRMLRLGAEVGARTITVVWDRGHVDWPEEKTRAVVLKFLYDKVSTCFRVMGSDVRGIIVADEPGGGSGDQKAWLASTRPLTEKGTEYSVPDRIVLPILMTQSHHVPHMQLADLVAGATVAAVAGNPYALDLVPDLEKLIHRGSADQVGGVGLTLWPPELGNLYHHIFGDTHRWKGNNGFPYPIDGWDYSENDGIPSR